MNEYEQNIEIMKDLRNRLDKVINKDAETTTEYPDAKKHLYVSLAKSGIRVVAGACLIAGFPIWCGIGLVAAEVLGVVEELV